MTPQEIHAQFMTAAITGIMTELEVLKVWVQKGLNPENEIAVSARKIADAALEEYQKRWKKQAVPIGMTHEQAEQMFNN